MATIDNLNIICSTLCNLHPIWTIDFVSNARQNHTLTFYISVNLRVDWQASRYTETFVRHLPGILMSLMAFSLLVDCDVENVAARGVGWEEERKRFLFTVIVDERHVSVWLLSLTCLEEKGDETTDEGVRRAPPAQKFPLQFWNSWTIIMKLYTWWKLIKHAISHMSLTLSAHKVEPHIQLDLSWEMFSLNKIFVCRNGICQNHIYMRKIP